MRLINKKLLISKEVEEKKAEKRKKIFYLFWEAKKKSFWYVALARKREFLLGPQVETHNRSRCHKSYCQWKLATCMPMHLLNRTQLQHSRVNFFLGGVGLRKWDVHLPTFSFVFYACAHALLTSTLLCFNGSALLIKIYWINFANICWGLGW